MRRGFFGGSFDPVHWGHLLLAETAREFCSLDKVIFVPAGIPPHKADLKRAPGENRFKMLQGALSRCPEYEVSRFEIDSPGVNYTVETLRHYRKTYPNDEFFLITGAETFMDIPGWYCPDEICKLTSFIIALRPGHPVPDFDRFRDLAPEITRKQWAEQIIPMPQIDLSSTLIRKRRKEGKSIRFLTPETVENYILQNDLYTK
ncbi:MAG: nicotinate-nucleotide adenylyltransferase [Planctomycetia bacterium]|nr:nicotinate-nucleotide adenylyltransferase [Planctomycetia bacterium]